MRANLLSLGADCTILRSQLCQRKGYDTSIPTTPSHEQTNLAVACVKLDPKSLPFAVTITCTEYIKDLLQVSNSLTQFDSHDSKVVSKSLSSPETIKKKLGVFKEYSEPNSCLRTQIKEEHDKENYGVRNETCLLVYSDSTTVIIRLFFAKGVENIAGLKEEPPDLEVYLTHFFVRTGIRVVLRKELNTSQSYQDTKRGALPRRKLQELSPTISEDMFRTGPIFDFLVTNKLRGDFYLKNRFGEGNHRAYKERPFESKNRNSTKGNWRRSLSCFHDENQMKSCSRNYGYKFYPFGYQGMMFKIIVYDDINLFLFVADCPDLRTNPFQERGYDMIPASSTDMEQGARMKLEDTQLEAKELEAKELELEDYGAQDMKYEYTPPVTRSRTKKLTDHITTLITSHENHSGFVCGETTLVLSLTRDG